MFVYADNAATTKNKQRGAYSDDKCFENYYGNPSSLHSSGQQAAEQLFNARERIAKSLMLPLQEKFILPPAEVRQIIRQFFPLPKTAEKRKNAYYCFCL